MSMVIEKVVRKYQVDKEPSDFSFWKKRTVAERLQALEQIRREYINWRYDAEPGFQRVYRVIKQK